MHNPSALMAVKVSPRKTTAENTAHNHVKSQT